MNKDRRSHQRYSVRKGVLRIFAKFTGNHLCQSLFFNKVPGLRPATLLKKSLWHRCIPVNFAKFLRTPFFPENLRTTASEDIKTLRKAFGINSVSKTFLVYSSILRWSGSDENSSLRNTLNLLVRQCYR